MIPRWVVLTAGLAVGLAGAALTATGLTAVALGSGVSPRLAWLYVASTDGLALTAYGATTVLGRRRYPWLVVLASAGLSGLAQAAHLAQGGGAVSAVEWTWLRFGVGYWPAVSVAVCAHLVWLVAARHGAVTVADEARSEPAERTYDALVEALEATRKTGITAPAVALDERQLSASRALDERQSSAESNADPALDERVRERPGLALVGTRPRARRGARKVLCEHCGKRVAPSTRRAHMAKRRAEAEA